MELDARVIDVVHDLPGKERRAVTHAPFRPCLDSLVEELADGEQVRALSAAVNSRLGRGVLALTASRLVFCCSRSGASSWPLEDVRDVEGRTKQFTLPAAITVHFDDQKLVFTLGVGRRSAPGFIAAVSAAVPALSGTAA